MRQSDLVKKRKVVGALKKVGFKKIKSKGPHEKWRHPDTGLTIAIPHGRQINKILAIKVLKQAGIID